MKCFLEKMDLFVINGGIGGLREGGGEEFLVNGKNSVRRLVTTLEGKLL